MWAFFWEFAPRFGSYELFDFRIKAALLIIIPGSQEYASTSLSTLRCVDCVTSWSSRCVAARVSVTSAGLRLFLVLLLSWPVISGIAGGVDAAALTRSKWVPELPGLF